MTNRTHPRMVTAASIVPATGQPGAHSDDSTFESTGDHTGREASDGQIARSFFASGDRPVMTSRLLKHNTAVRLAPALEVRFAGGAKDGAIEGYASTFGGPPDSYGDIIAPGAFHRTLADIKAEGVQPAMLWSHDPAAPIGSWHALEEDDNGLLVRGRLNLATTRGRDAYEHLKEGDVSGLSIGFLVAKDGSRSAGNGKTLLTDLDLLEISVVAFPANRRARAQVKNIGSKAELVDMLRESGLSKSAAARVAAGGWPALAGADHSKAIALAADIERATANLRNMK